MIVYSIRTIYGLTGGEGGFGCWWEYCRPLPAAAENQFSSSIPPSDGSPLRRWDLPVPTRRDGTHTQSGNKAHRSAAVGVRCSQRADVVHDMIKWSVDWTPDGGGGNYSTVRTGPLSNITENICSTDEQWQSLKRARHVSVQTIHIGHC